MGWMGEAYLGCQALQSDDVVLHCGEQLLEAHRLGSDAPSDLVALPLLVQRVVVSERDAELLDRLVATRQLHLEQLDLVGSDHQGAVELGVDGGHATAHQQLRLGTKHLVVFERLLGTFQHEQVPLVLHHDEGVVCRSRRWRNRRAWGVVVVGCVCAPT